VAVGVSGDTNPRLRIDAGGRLTWGTGAAAGDIYAERNGANSLLVSGELLADSYQVDVAATPTGAVGKLIWNDTEGTLDLGLKGGNVTLPVGQTLTQRVTNTTGNTLARGKAVRLAGAQGNRTTVALAQGDTDANSSKTFGLTAEAISDSHSGFVITEGLLTGLDTSTLTEGGIVWLSATTAGALTSTMPDAPNHGVMMGLCVKSHASTGIILVKVQNGYELGELHDVKITSPTNGQVLSYDAALGYWKNAAGGGGGGGASVSVGDSAPAGPSAGDLWFNSANLKTYIYYDSYWVEVGGGAGGGGGSSVTTSDTAPTSPNPGDVWYDSTTGRTYLYYDSFWVEMRSTSDLTVAGHTAEHVRGGNDVLDGDRLQVDYVPTAYTRDTASAGGGAVTDLTAHLGGIDDQLIVLASGRNRIVNGGILVNQRYGVNTQTARTGSRFPIADRFFGYANGGGSINTVTTGTVTPPPHGGNYYLQATVNATDSSLAASDLYSIHTEVEGFYLNGLGFGYSAPPSVTLSFYVYSSVTGTFSLTMSNGVPVGDRYYTTSYTINAANTWERKAITFVSPTTGVWDTTSLVLSIHWPLAAGSNFINPYPTNWQSTPGPYMITAAQTNFMANAGAVFRLTGVQLEIGSDPTPFENTRYAEELLRCQRYYQVTDYFQGTAATSSTIVVVAPALVPMRGTIVPSIAGTTWALSDNYAGDANASSPTMPNIYECSSRGARVVLGGFTGLTTGRYYNSRPSTTSLIGLSAEALS
jgi:hypothetical protein